MRRGWKRSDAGYRHSRGAFHSRVDWLVVTPLAERQGRIGFTTGALRPALFDALCVWVQVVLVFSSLWTAFSRGDVARLFVWFDLLGDIAY